MFSSLDLVCMRRASLQVRDSLEKVRERMYGQFGGMQQSMQKLSQEIRVKNSAAPCDCLRKCVKLEIRSCTLPCGFCRRLTHIGGVWSQR